MRRLFLFCILALMCNSIFGQWNVSSITDSHLLNTGILVRRYASDIKFINDKVVVSENLVITILDKDILSGFGVIEIESLGKEFNADIMEAIDTKEGEQNKVLKVHKKGYMLIDKVLRPAQVIVGRKD